MLQLLQLVPLGGGAFQLHAIVVLKHLTICLEVVQVALLYLVYVLPDEL